MSNPRTFRGLAWFSASALVAWVLAIGYLFCPSFAKFAPWEVTVTVGAQQWLHGLPLYMPVDSPALYSLLYGPMEYLWTALGLVLFKDPIFGGKFFGVFLFLLSTLIFTWAARRTLSWPMALFALGVYCMEFLFLPQFSFGIAVNSCLALVAVLGLVSTTISNWKMRVALVAFATGLAFDCKLHGPIYLLPAWLLMLRELGFFRTLWCGLFALEFAILPFLLPGISLRNQVDWISVIGHRPREMRLFVETVFFELRFAGPVFLLLAIDRFGGWPLEARLRWMTYGLVAGLLLVMAPAANAGAGYHHIWPFIPWISYVTATALQSLAARPLTSRTFRIVEICALAFALMLACGASKRIADCSIFVLDTSVRNSVQDDVKTILASYPDTPLQMGCSGDFTYDRTYFAPLLYQRPTPCLVDPVAAGESVESGRSILPILPVMFARTDDLWLIPKGEPPFSITGLYPPRVGVFNREFQDQFLAHFHRIGSSKYFDIYGYK